MFLRQEIALGTAANNVLNGQALFHVNSDFLKIKEVLYSLVNASEWAWFHIDYQSKSWIKRSEWSGDILINKKFEDQISVFDKLWVIELRQNSNHIELRVIFHHVLADAHTFQLFWENLLAIYEGREFEKTSFFSNLIVYQPLEIQNIKPIEMVGLGPIKRINITIPKHKKIWAELKSKDLNLNLSTVLLGCLQQQLEATETILDMKFQTGFALRNRSGKTSKKDFSTHVNFLPIAHVDALHFHDLQSQIKTLFRHQDYPLLAWLEDHKKTAAFNVLFSFQKETYHQTNGEIGLKELTFLPTDVDENIICVHVLEFGDGQLKLNVDVRTDLADLSFWRSWCSQFVLNINRFLNGESLQFNQSSAVLYGNAHEKVDLFEYFNKAPDNKTAIIINDVCHTFGELQAAVNTKRETKKEILELSPNRSIENIIDILKAWKFGQTITFSQNIEAKVPEGQYLYLAETSGSTGNPKQIWIGRKGIESLLPAWKSRLDITEDSIHLSLADQRFDVFFGDLFRSLFLGSTLVLASENERLSPKSIVDLVSKYAVTHLETTPSFLQLLLDDFRSKGSLRTLICGSEPMNFDLLNQISILESDGLKIYNSFGLTEVSIDSSIGELMAHENYFPVGFPLGHQHFEIQNKRGQLNPMGTWGELVIKGECVGTMDEIMQSEGQREYKTGDRAMLIPNYGLIVKGRIQDDFIKVNGKRIPARDMEVYLSKTTQAKHAYILEIKGLAVLIHNIDWEEKKIKAILQTKFAKHQCPDVLIRSEDWPLNQNGKIDKTALKARVKIESHEGPPWKPNSNPTEQELFNLLCTFKKPIGSKAQALTQLGWNSIDLLSLCNSLMLKGLQVSAHEIMNEPSIAYILKSIEKHGTQKTSNIREVEVDDADLDQILGLLNNDDFN